jgi:cytochrome c-type biogenesis protein CcmH/NrfG
MLAMDAYQQHEYQKAIDYWSSLLILLPQNSSESKAIRKAISKAHNMLEKPS